METKRNLIIKVLKTCLMCIFAVLFLFPLCWMVSSSLKGTVDVFASPYKWIPVPAKWSNYRMVWMNKDLPLLRVFGNSLFISIISTLGQLLFSSMAAYAFARIPFKGKHVIFTLFLSSMMIPSQVTIIPRFMMFKSIGLYNTPWSLILPGLFGASTIFFLRQAYIALPNDLMDAARIDGASHLKIFPIIMLPLTIPSLVSMLILSFISMWNDYLSPLIFLVKPRMYVISQAIRYWMLDEAQRYELTMATATSSIVPILIIFLAGQKYFIEGIATSGMKE